jgi:hypothetical protein
MPFTGLFEDLKGVNKVGPGEAGGGGRGGPPGAVVANAVWGWAADARSKAAAPLPATSAEPLQSKATAARRGEGLGRQGGHAAVLSCAAA